MFRCGLPLILQKEMHPKCASMCLQEDIPQTSKGTSSGKKELDPLHEILKCEMVQIFF